MEWLWKTCEQCWEDACAIVARRRGDSPPSLWCTNSDAGRLITRVGLRRGEAKTAGSVRVIALDRLTVTFLRRHHATTAHEGHGGGFVFTNTRGDSVLVSLTGYVRRVG